VYPRGSPDDQKTQGEGDEVLGLAHPVEVYLLKEFHVSRRIPLDTGLAQLVPAFCSF
jgi:hypothetical protein